MAENQERQYVPVDTTNGVSYNPYKPRFISYFTMGFAAIGVLALLVFVSVKVFTEVLTLDAIVVLLTPCIPYETPMLIVGILGLTLAIVSEVRSRIKTPPATYRVKNELIRTLSQFGLLDINDTSHWKGMFAVAPVGRFNREAQSFTLPFLLRHANAKQSFEKMGDAISGFARCHSAEVAEDNSRRMYNCKLILWYTDNPYGEVTMDDLFGDD